MARTITRRRFVAKSMAMTGVAGALGLGLSTPRRVRGANERVRCAVCGVHSRGDNLIHWVKGVDDAELVALADVDTKVLGERAESTEKRYEIKLDREQDFRRLLDRKDIDAIVVATPNHWHSLLSIMAMQAGKDVYCEKPVSHNVWEGRQLVNAARKYDKIVQTGTQSRSSPSMVKMIEYLRAGELGKVQKVVGLCYKGRKAIGKLDKPLQISDSVDYDLWCGPAEKVDLYRPRLHYDWHWDFNTGNGDLGNQGIHQMDLARWFAGYDHLSPRVMSVGGRIASDDAGNTPNTQIVYHDYGDVPIFFEVRGLKTEPLHNVSIGIIVYCEGGRMEVGSYSSGKAVDHDGKTIKPFSGGGDHMGNFIAAVKSRKRDTLFAEIEQGHLSSALCHTGNISYRLGKPSDKGAIMEQVKGDAKAADSFERFAEHCATNGVDVNSDAIALGPWLEMDPKNEVFTNHAQANAMLTRAYRKPFVVPDLSA